MKPTPKWSVRTSELGRRELTFLSRRMIYTGRRVLLAIHLVDDRPTVLCGNVTLCEYDGQGLHRIEIELTSPPVGEAIRRWAQTSEYRPGQSLRSVA